MNFLAHIYLSGDNTDLMIGNFIADAVKGKKQFNKFPLSIQQGIILHRAIDKYTDQHPIIKQGINRLRPYQGRYASVLVDIYYDYLLVKNWENYSSVDLKTFTKTTYQKLEANHHLMPSWLHRGLPKMIREDWLTKYGTVEGLNYTFMRLSERVTFDSNIETAAADFMKYEAIFLEEFNQFFPDIMEFVEIQTPKILKG